MAILTIGDVMTRCLQRADMEKSGASGYIGTQELQNLVQLGFAQLHNLVVNSYEYWIKSTTVFTTTIDQVKYSFQQIGAADLYKPLAVGIVQSANQPFESWTPLEHWDMNNQNLPASGFIQFTNGFYTDMRYLFLADAIELRPVKAQVPVLIYYVPLPQQFAGPQDTLPYWCKPGWEEYVVAFVAWMIAGKEGTGTQITQQIWAMISDQIKNFTPNRDQFKPYTVQDSWRSRGGSNDIGGGFYAPY